MQTSLFARFFCSAALFFTLATGSSTAATFSADFATPPSGATAHGSAIQQAGVLTLTSATAQTGSFVIEDFQGGESASGFVATFDLSLGGAGEGVSFSYAPDVVDDAFGEFGSGNGFTISFLPQDGRVIVRREGQEVVSAPVTFSAQAMPVRVEVIEGFLTLNVNNQTVVDGRFAYLPIPGRFAFGARTSDVAAQNAIDNLAISTTIQTGPFVRFASPSGSSASPASAIVVELQDFAFEVDPATVALSFNNSPVAAMVVKSDAVTRIEFDPPGNLEDGREYPVRVAFTAGGVSRTVDFAFTVSGVNVIPSNFAHASLDTNKTGFRIRVVQASATPILSSTLERAEAQLAGTLTNAETGLVYTNEANLADAGPGGSLQETNVINYVDVGTRGRFANDQPIPGIPGTTDHYENFASEIITWLYLPAGQTTFGITSDDSFRLQTGFNARDASALVLGEFEGVRAGGETLFNFVVDQAGYYSFRLVWEQSDGPASLEWFSLNGAGERILINDLSNPDAILAYRAGPNFPYLSVAQPAPGTTVSTNATINLELTNGETTVATNTIQLTLNSQLVAAQITASGTNATAIRFSPASPFLPGSVQTVKLVFQDSAQRSFTNQYSFNISSDGAPELSIEALPNATVSVTWTGGGTLEETSALSFTGASWVPVQGAGNGQYTTSASGSRRFFRVRAQ